MFRSIGFLLLISVAVATTIFAHFEDRKQLASEELVLRKLEAKVLDLGQINSWQNELLLRNRVGIDGNYDDIVLASYELEQAVIAAAALIESIGGNSDLTTGFEKLENALIIKLDDIESFKSHNSVLRNSERFMPVVGQQLTAIALQQEFLKEAYTLTDIVSKISEFTKLGSKVYTAQQLRAYEEDITNMFDIMPSHSETKMFEFFNHYKTALKEKTEADAYLLRASNGNVSDQIVALAAVVDDILLKREFKNGPYTMLLIAAGGLVILVSCFLLLFQYFSERRLKASLASTSEKISEQVMFVESAFERLEAGFERFGSNEATKTVADLVVQLCTAVKQKDNAKVNQSIRELVNFDRDVKGLDKVLANDSFVTDNNSRINTLKESLDYLKTLVSKT